MPAQAGPILFQREVAHALPRPEGTVCKAGEDSGEWCPGHFGLHMDTNMALGVLRVEQECVLHGDSRTRPIANTGFRAPKIHRIGNDLQHHN